MTRPAVTYTDHSQYQNNSLASYYHFNFFVGYCFFIVTRNIWTVLGPMTIMMLEDELCCHLSVMCATLDWTFRSAIFSCGWYNQRTNWWGLPSTCLLLQLQFGPQWRAWSITAPRPTTGLERHPGLRRWAWSIAALRATAGLDHWGGADKGLAA